MTVADGCAVQTPNRDLRGTVSVDGDAVVVSLQARKRFFIILYVRSWL